MNLFQNNKDIKIKRAEEEEEGERERDPILSYYNLSIVKKSGEGASNINKLRAPAPARARTPRPFLSQKKKRKKNVLNHCQSLPIALLRHFFLPSVGDIQMRLKVKAQLQNI